MKKIILITVSVITVNTINAQFSELATIDASNKLEFSRNPIKKFTLSKKDLSYSESIKGFDEAISIQELENTISTYNLKEDVIYDNSEKAIYTITFKQNNANAVVIYNNNGAIIKSNEKYKNVKLPYPIAFSILKNHPQFYIKKTTIYKEFKEESGVKTIYKVLVSNGIINKTLEYHH